MEDPKNLTQITKELADLNEAKSSLTRSYQNEISDIDEKLKKLKGLEVIALSGFDVKKVQIAQSILDISGKVWNFCEGKSLVQLASVDIANGCPNLKTKYFGNKRYDRFYQRCDTPYNCGPRHGYIVEMVGLKREFRSSVLTEEEKDACIYYLLNLEKINNSS